MKKISILLAMAAVAVGFTSCEEDRDPVYHNPTEFVLNQPAMQDQYIELTAGNTLELVASQPDYGYSAVATYTAEMSLTPDFTTFESVIPTDEHQTRMNFKQEDIALALCNLLGVKGEDDFNERYPDGMPYMKVYFRAVSRLGAVENPVEGSEITSNTVVYNNIKGYLAVKTAAYIYLVGDPNGWNINAGPEWRLYEQIIGSNVYVGEFDVQPGQYFRFYTQIGDWGSDGQLPSIGANPVDGDSNPVEWVDGSFTQAAVPGKGSWYMQSDFAGGIVTMVVDLNEWTVTFYEGSVSPGIKEYVYMIGNNGGWAEPNEDAASVYDKWRLECADGSGVYANTFDFSDFSADGGSLYCRFYKELTGWGPAEWSSDANGGNVDVVSGVAAPTFAGDGCFVIPAAGHKINVVLDTNLDQVTFTYVD